MAQPAPWAKRSALVLASTLFAFGLAEGGLRLLSVGDPILRDVDPILGWAPIPGAEGWWTREGRSHVVISEHGFRGVDVPPGDPGDTLRVAVLGDSYTEAHQVALEDAFPAHVERALEGCVGRPVEVLSFGVSGYGTAQEYRLWHHRVRDYRPDVVLVALLTGNDIADNHEALRRSGDPAPYFVLREGQLALDDSFLRSPGYQARAAGGPSRWLRRHSRLVRILSAIGQPRRTRERGELGLRDEVYSPPRNARWEDAWARTEAILRRMDGSVRATGARFGVVTLSNAAQVDPDPEERARTRAALGVDDLFYPDRRVADAGERDGYPVLNLAPPLREYAEREGVHLHGFPNTTMGTGHWNEAGHRVAGERIGRWLCETLR